MRVKCSGFFFAFFEHKVDKHFIGIKIQVGRSCVSFKIDDMFPFDSGESRKRGLSQTFQN